MKNGEENLFAPKEGVRAWYNRTTGKWRKIIVVSTIGALLAGIVFFEYAPVSIISRLQIYNGAWTIPVAALIWILAFVYIFLVPSREVGFRSQEWIEAAVKILQKTISEEIAPAARVWTRIGERVEKELPAMLAEAREGIQLVRTSAVKIEEAVQKNDKVADQVKPVVEALKRIEERIEHEIRTGIIDDVRQAAISIQTFAGPGAAKKVPASDQPDMTRILPALARKKA
jgi:hypothetical protein